MYRTLKPFVWHHIIYLPADFCGEINPIIANFLLENGYLESQDIAEDTSKYEEFYENIIDMNKWFLENVTALTPVADDISTEVTDEINTEENITQ